MVSPWEPRAVSTVYPAPVPESSDAGNSTSSNQLLGQSLPPSTGSRKPKKRRIPNTREPQLTPAQAAPPCLCQAPAPRLGRGRGAPTPHGQGAAEEVRAADRKLGRSGDVCPSPARHQTHSSALTPQGTTETGGQTRPLLLAPTKEP